MKDLIRIDKQGLYDCFIETEKFLELTLGENTEGEPLELGHLEESIEDKWLAEVEPELYGFVCAHANALAGKAVPYLCMPIANTYNGPNDLSSEFQWQVFYPSDSGDHYWSNEVYVAVEVHLGGDVRGNYGRVRLYGPIDNLAETGFFDMSLGWYVLDSEGEDVQRVNDEVCVGYSSEPTSHLESLLDEGCEPAWCEEKKAFRVLIDEEICFASPDCCLPRW